VVFGLCWTGRAWAAFGNLIGDFSAPWQRQFLRSGQLSCLPALQDVAKLPLEQIPALPRFVAAVLLGALSCALVIGFGVEVFKLLPFAIIALAVFINNGLISLILGTLLLRLLTPRVSRWDLYWREQMDPEDCPLASAALGRPLWAGRPGSVWSACLLVSVLEYPHLLSLPVVLAPLVAAFLWVVAIRRRVCVRPPPRRCCKPWT
jgi:hypothetical protein